MTLLTAWNKTGLAEVNCSLSIEFKQMAAATLGIQERKHVWIDMDQSQANLDTTAETIVEGWCSLIKECHIIFKMCWNFGSHVSSLDVLNKHAQLNFLHRHVRHQCNASFQSAVNDCSPIVTSAYLITEGVNFRIWAPEHVYFTCV